MATAASAAAARSSSSAVAPPTPVADPRPVSDVAAESSTSDRSGDVVVPNGRSLAVSASVGHDHWASDVLSAVQPSSEATSASTSTGSDQQAPAAVAVAAESVPASAESATTTVADGRKEDGKVFSVEDLVMEKKRKFHSGRMLELKNLPDGCTEQVSQPLLALYSFFPFCAFRIRFVQYTPAFDLFQRVIINELL